MGEEYTHHLPPEREHYAAQVIRYLFPGCPEPARNFFLRHHLVIFCRVENFTGGRHFKDSADAFTIDVPDCAGQSSCLALPSYAVR